MKKVGGVLLVILGVALLILSCVHAFNILSSLISGVAISSYAIDHLTGSVIGLVIFGALGYKSVKKGSALVKAVN